MFFHFYLFFSLLFLSSLSFSKPSLATAIPKTTETLKTLAATPSKAPAVKEKLPSKTKSSTKTKIDINALLKKMDKLFRQEKSISEVTMTIENPKWPSSRSISLKMWAKGESLTLIKILSPKKDKDIGTLKRDQDIWNYFPKIAKQIKVPASMMMGSWMGSDFTNDDLVKESSYTKDFKATATQDKENYHITLTPNAKTISIWDKILMTIDKKTSLPKEYSFFNERGEKIRTLFFKEPKIYSGVKLPSKLTMISHTEKGKKTSFEYKKMNFKEKIDDSFFSFKNLQKKDL